MESLRWHSWLRKWMMETKMYLKNESISLHCKNLRISKQLLKDTIQTEPLADSTKSTKLFDAMAATSNSPPLMDRVHVNVDGRTRCLADGGTNLSHLSCYWQIMKASSWSSIGSDSKLWTQWFWRGIHNVLPLQRPCWLILMFLFQRISPEDVTTLFSRN